MGTRLRGFVVGLGGLQLGNELVVSLIERVALPEQVYHHIAIQEDHS